MSSNSEKQSKSKPLKLKKSIFSIARYLISSWRTYINLTSWATVVVLVIFVITGEAFTKNGLILITILPLPILLYYLDKWLEKHNEL